MHFRKLAVAAGVASAILAQGVSALGLGEVKLNSTLNEPLDAEIKLLQVRDLSEQEILVGLASDADFDRASVEKIFFLNGIKFEVDLKSVTGPVVKLSSTKPVTEPYLNFLLETRWPSGRLLREYTLLMDLPVFTEEARVPVQAARRRTPAVSHKNQVRDPRRDQPQFEERRQATQPQQAEQNNQAGDNSNQAGGDSYGPVSADDTLWAIALKVRPSRGVSVQQTMLAIQRLNPDAFINNNINLLKRGKVLRVPTGDEIEQLSARQAITQVADQNTAWSGNSAGRLSGAPLDASSSDSYSSGDNEQATGRVKLASASNNVSGNGSNGSAQQGEQLQQAMEQLDKAKRENDELKSRIQDLEDQIQTMERLVSVTNEQLTALQQASAEAAQKQQENSVADAGQAAEDSSSANLAANQDVAASQQDDKPQLDNESAAANNDNVAKLEDKPKPKKAKPAAVVSQPKPEPGLIDMIMENLIWIGGGLLAILLAVWALLRRNKQEDEDEFDGAADMEEGLGLESAVDDDLDVLDDVEADSNETVSEADVYIAYGKFDKAEGILNNILASDPANIDARLKLMEVHAETGNGEGFEEQYQQVADAGNEDEVARAEQMREAFGLGGVADADDQFGLGLDDDEDQTVVAAKDEGSTTDALDALAFDIGFDDERDETLETAIADSADLDDASEPSDPGLDFESIEMDEPVASSSEPQDDFSIAGLELDEQDVDSEDDRSSEDLADDSLAAEAQENSGNYNFTASFDLDNNDFAVDGGSSSELGDELDTNSAELAELEVDDSAEGDSLVEDNAEAQIEESGVADSLDNELDFDFDESSFEVADDSSETPALAQENTQEIDEAFEDELDKSFGDISLAGDNVDQPEQDGDDQGLDFSTSLDNDFEIEDDFDVAALDKELDTDFDLEGESETNAVASNNNADLDELEASIPSLDGVEVAEQPTAVSPEEPSGLDLAADDDDFDAELDFLSDSDEVATKLDLARAYMDMGDKEGAKEILQEVLAEGDDQQKLDAEELISRMA